MSTSGERNEELRAKIQSRLDEEDQRAQLDPQREKDAARLASEDGTDGHTWPPLPSIVAPEPVINLAASIDELEVSVLRTKAERDKYRAALWELKVLAIVMENLHKTEIWKNINSIIDRGLK